jgi:hypothetical protein
MKKVIAETIKLPIPVAMTEEWEVDIKWEELIAIKDVLPNDVFLGHTWEYKEVAGFGSEAKTYRVPFLVIRRQREETDDEYLLRLKGVEKILRQENEKEYLEYLRLKAKYE